MGSSIFKATFASGGLSVQLVDEGANGDGDKVDAGAAPVSHMVFAGAGEVWSGTKRGEICVWDCATGQKKRSFAVGAGVYSMCAVEMWGALTVWLGCEDEVRVLDCASRLLRCILPLPMAGHVTCIANASPDIVWTATRSLDNKGALYIWDPSL